MSDQPDKVWADDDLASRIRDLYANDIRTRKKQLEELQREFDKAVQDLQEDCPHQLVLRVRFKAGIAVDREERRCCPACKLRHYGWTGYGHPLDPMYNAAIKSVVDVEDDDYAKALQW